MTFLSDVLSARPTRAGRARPLAVKVSAPPENGTENKFTWPVPPAHLKQDFKLSFRKHCRRLSKPSGRGKRSHGNSSALVPSQNATQF